MMSFHRWLLRYFLPYRWLVSLLVRIPFPGNKEKNMGQVLGFFLLKLPDEAITTKASAVAFNFFLALIPAFIVLFTLIPFIPIDGIQKQILDFVEGFVPANTYELIQETITDILKTKRTGLLSITFVITIYFASNGFSALLAALDPYGSFWEQKLKSFVLMFVITFLLVVAVLVSIASELVFVFVDEKILSLSKYESYGIMISKWVVLLALTYFSVAIMYWTGSPKKIDVTFFSPGAWLSTVSILLISLGYGYYVENFAQYNKFYGSLGALVVTMLWMYLCSLVVVIWHVYNETHARFK